MGNGIKVEIHFGSPLISLTDKQVEPIVISGRHIPNRFSARFPVMGGKVIFNDWEVILNLEIEKDGSPRVREMRIPTKPSSNSLSPFLQRWQIEMIEKEFQRLIVMAVTEAAETLSYVKTAKSSKWVLHEYEDASRAFRREVENLSHRRTLTREHFEKVAEIYNREFARASASKSRPRMIREIMDQMGASRGAAELWVRAAKAIPGLIPDQLTKDSQSVKSVGSKKPSTTNKKGKK